MGYSNIEVEIQLTVVDGIFPQGNEWITTWWIYIYFYFFCFTQGI